MSVNASFNIRKILVVSLWVLLTIGVVALLVSAVHNSNGQTCTGMKITIKGKTEKHFIDEQLITRVLVSHVPGGVKGKKIKSIDLHAIESSLLKDIWIKEAKLFFDNNGLLQVEATEREPAVRVFTQGGESFFVDSNLVIMPLSDLFAARLPVFTGFPNGQKSLNGKDSLMLRDVVKLGLYIKKNSLLMALVDQIDITNSGEFELIPKFENQLVQLGNADRMEEKLHNMLLFYKQLWMNGSLTRYSKISVKYKNQVVASIRGAGEQQADSLKALQTLYQIAYEAERQANDSILKIQQDNEKNTVDSSMAQQKIERDEMSQGSDINISKVPVKKENQPANAPAQKQSAAPVKKDNKANKNASKKQNEKKDAQQKDKKTVKKTTKN